MTTAVPTAVPTVDPPKGGTSDAYLEKLVADLARAAVALLRGMLDDAYRRGRDDALADARRVTVNSPANVVITGGGAPSPAIMAAMAQQATMRGQVRA